MRTALAVCVVATLVAGCTQVVTGRPGFPYHHETHEVEYPNFPGLILNGTLSGKGDTVRLDASARNQGPNTYKVSSICVTPWSDSMESSLGEVHRTSPQAHCDAFGLKSFPPGSHNEFQATWNGTLWDLQRERYVEASPGRYMLHLLFEAYSGGAGQTDYDGHDWVQTQFTVTLAAGS